jgi:hypothetical protein
MYFSNLVVFSAAVFALHGCKSSGSKDVNEPQQQGAAGKNSNGARGAPAKPQTAPEFEVIEATTAADYACRAALMSIENRMDNESHCKDNKGELFCQSVYTVDGALYDQRKFTRVDQHKTAKPLSCNEALARFPSSK